jgi:hypothetical protein
MLGKLFIIITSLSVAIIVLLYYFSPFTATFGFLIGFIAGIIALMVFSKLFNKNEIPPEPQEKPGIDANSGTQGTIDSLRRHGKKRPGGSVSTMDDSDFGCEEAFYIAGDLITLSRLALLYNAAEATDATGTTDLMEAADYALWGLILSGMGQWVIPELPGDEESDIMKKEAAALLFQITGGVFSGLAVYHGLKAMNGLPQLKPYAIAVTTLGWIGLAELFASCSCYL